MRRKFKMQSTVSIPTALLLLGIGSVANANENTLTTIEYSISQGERSLSISADIDFDDAEIKCSDSETSRPGERKGKVASFALPAAGFQGSCKFSARSNTQNVILSGQFGENPFGQSWIEMTTPTPAARAKLNCLFKDGSISTKQTTSDTALFTVPGGSRNHCVIEIPTDSNREDVEFIFPKVNGMYISAQSDPAEEYWDAIVRNDFGNKVLRPARAFCWSQGYFDAAGSDVDTYPNLPKGGALAAYFLEVSSREEQSIGQTVINGRDQWPPVLSKVLCSDSGRYPTNPSPKKSVIFFNPKVDAAPVYAGFNDSKQGYYLGGGTTGAVGSEANRFGKIVASAARRFCFANGYLDATSSRFSGWKGTGIAVFETYSPFGLSTSHWVTSPRVVYTAYILDQVVCSDVEDEISTVFSGKTVADQMAAAAGDVKVLGLDHWSFHYTAVTGASLNRPVKGVSGKLPLTLGEWCYFAEQSNSLERKCSFDAYR